MEADVVAIVEEALHAVGRDAGGAEVPPVGARPSPSWARSSRQATACCVSVLITAASRRRAWATAARWRASPSDRDGHLRIGDHLLQRGVVHVVRRRPRAARGSSRSPPRAAAAHSSRVRPRARRDARRAQRRVPRRRARAPRAASPRATPSATCRQIGLQRAGLDLRHRRKYARVTSLVLSGNANLRQAVERAGEVIDRVVGHRERAVAALVAHLEPVVDDVLLAHLHVVRDPLAVHRLAPSTFVQRRTRRRSVALVLEQPRRRRCTGRRPPRRR